MVDAFCVYGVHYPRAGLPGEGFWPGTTERRAKGGTPGSGRLARQMGRWNLCIEHKGVGPKFIGCARRRCVLPGDSITTEAWWAALQTRESCSKEPCTSYLAQGTLARA